MIWSFIGGFVTGAIVMFGSLFICAIFSLKKKQKAFESAAKKIYQGGVSC